MEDCSSTAETKNFNKNSLKNKITVEIEEDFDENTLNYENFEQERNE